jgi:hypothetical protein
VYVNRCPSSYYCVKVYQVRSARNMAGWATLNYDPGTNTAWYGTLHLNTRYLTTAAARRKTACHELGHIFGLDHRRTGRTCMRDGFATMYGHPDAADYANLRRIYANAATWLRNSPVPVTLVGSPVAPAYTVRMRVSVMPGAPAPTAWWCPRSTATCCGVTSAGHDPPALACPTGTGGPRIGAPTLSAPTTGDQASLPASRPPTRNSGHLPVRP